MIKFLLVLLAVGVLTAAYNGWRGCRATSAEQGGGYWMVAGIGVLLMAVALLGLALAAVI
jgi:hypothetical protein